MHKELHKLFIIRHTGDTMKNAIFVETSSAQYDMDMRVKIQDLSSRMNASNHHWNKSIIFKGNLEAFFILSICEKELPSGELVIVSGHQGTTKRFIRRGDSSEALCNLHSQGSFAR